MSADDRSEKSAQSDNWQSDDDDDDYSGGSGSEDDDISDVDEKRLIEDSDDDVDEGVEEGRLESPEQAHPARFCLFTHTC